MKYRFYGADNAPLTPLNNLYPKIHQQFDLYDALSEIWCLDSCAPAYKKQWSKDNMTVGQCSITAFLVQDIFGGEVYGYPLKEGGYHCYNVINGVRIDLTSEQFGDEKLNYEDIYLQSRKEHFANQEKYERYLYLVNALKKYCL